MKNNYIKREQQIKDMNTTELAQFLFDFSCAFYTERIEGICDIECKDSKNSCTGCIAKWLSENKEINFD